MKTKIYLILFTLALILAGCDKDKDEDKEIILSKATESTQTARADEENTGDGFTFTAKNSWIAKVTEVVPDTRDSEEENRVGFRTGSNDNGNVTWLKLLYNGSEKYSGNAGTITLKISLETNYTGKSRFARIEIICGNDKITINVSQYAENSDGKIPEDPNPGTGILLNKNSLSLIIGENEQLSANVQPSNATIKSVSWCSNANDIVTVDASGMVTAISPGNAIITVKSTVYEDIIATCPVTVYESSLQIPKLITNIEFKGWNIEKQRETSYVMKFIYDNQNRVSEVEEIYNNRDKIYLSVDYINENKIVYNIFEGGKDQPLARTTTFNLSNGYVVSTEFEEVDYADSQTISNYTYNNGYISRITDINKLTLSKSYTNYNWENENLIRIAYRYGDNNDNEEFLYPTFNDIKYTNHLNDKNVNIDLNGFLLGDDNGIFGFDLIGKRCKYYIDGYYGAEEYGSSSGSYEYYTETGIRETYSDYTFDEEGYVTEINSTVIWGERTITLATGEENWKTIGEPFIYRHIISYNR